MRLLELLYYHGSPEIDKVKGGFTQQYANVRMITDVEEYDRLRELSKTQNDLESSRSMDKMSNLVTFVKMPKPVFLTPDRHVANTYTDEHRAWDYQNANGGIVKVEMNEEPDLVIDARGNRFSYLPSDMIIEALSRIGVSSDDFHKLVTKYQMNPNHIRTDDLIPIAFEYGLNIIDVVNVRDNYNGSGPKTTVRMVFDVSMLSPT